MAAMVSQNILQQALALHQKGDTAAAEPLYRAVLAAQPAHGEAAHNLGRLLAEKGDHAEALAQFQTALKSEPRVAQHWLSYADALLLTGHPREAQLVLTRGRQRGLAGPQADILLQRAQAAISPADLQFERATAHAMRGEIQDAIAGYRQVIVLAPDHAEAHFRLGSLLSESGQIAEGFAHYMRRAALEHGGRPQAAGKP